MFFKPSSPPLVFACRTALLLLGFAAVTYAADDVSAPPDYRTVISSIFGKAASCRITGHYGGTYAGDVTLEIDFTTPNARSYQELKDLFLYEKPRYLGSKVRDDLGYGHINSFHFTWLDKQGKETAKAALLSGDLLTFNQKMLFTTSPPEYSNVTLQECVAYLILKKYPPKTSGAPSSSKGN